MNPHTSLRKLRTYTTTAQAISDLAVLESQGITSHFKGDTQADAHQVVMGTVELQVADSDLATARALLAEADRERFESTVPAHTRNKGVGRYVRVSLVAFVPIAALWWWAAPWAANSVGGFALVGFVSVGMAMAVGFVAALLDL